jgi:glucose uptake protein
VILPTTYPAAVVLLVFALLCLGSWANTQKLSGKWRFELYYYDYAIGAALFGLAAAFTLGSLNSQELTFQDNLLIASRRAMAYGFGAGMVFNLANMLLLGAMQVSGMSVAFPIAFGLALAIGAVSTYVLNPMSNAILLFAGAILTMIAVVTLAFAHVAHLDAQRQTKTPLRPDPRAPRPPRPPSPGVGIVLSLVSGILMSLYAPLSDAAREGETALSSYSAVLLFGGGILLSTFLYTPFFLNFPVQGRPVQLWDYLKGTKKQHLWGFLGGILWMAGTLAAYSAASGPKQPGVVVSFALSQAVPMAAVLWGLLAWREFQGATVRVKMLLMAMLVLYAAGIAVVAIAPLYPKL